MKKNFIRKATVCTLLLGATLCFSACGANAGDSPNTFIMENSASDETQDQEINVSEESSKPSVVDNDQESSSENDIHVIF